MPWFEFFFWWKCCTMLGCLFNNKLLELLLSREIYLNCLLWQPLSVATGPRGARGARAAWRVEEAVRPGFVCVTILPLKMADCTVPGTEQRHRPVTQIRVVSVVLYYCFVLHICYHCYLSHILCITTLPLKMAGPAVRAMGLRQCSATHSFVHVCFHEGSLFTCINQSLTHLFIESINQSMYKSNTVNTCLVLCASFRWHTCQRQLGRVERAECLQQNVWNRHADSNPSV
jgi:hypothetical protein